MAEEDNIEISMGGEPGQRLPEPYPPDEDFVPQGLPGDLVPTPVDAYPHDVGDPIPVRTWQDGRELRPSSLTGQFDSWPAKVIAVGTHADNPHTITALRIWYGWDATTNAPYVVDAPSAESSPTPALVTAYPFPSRHDQELYIAKAGDTVQIVSGRDGRCYYLNDELPFLAMVIPHGTTYTEDENGGTGYGWLKVRRIMLTGDPTAALVVTADLTLADGTTYIEYDFVCVVCPTGQAQGYRSGEYVWCQRRGQYIFAQAAKQQFLAQIVAAGPDEEAAATPPAYWVKELDATVAYSTNTYTYTTAVRPAADPKSKSLGRYGRWVLAYNVAGTAGVPIKTDGTVNVLVTMLADVATGEVLYVFDRSNGSVMVKLSAVGAAGHYTGRVQAWNAGTSAWVDTGGDIDAANLLETQALIAYTLNVTTPLLVQATLSGGVYWFSAFFPATGALQYMPFQQQADGKVGFDRLRIMGA